MLQCTAPSVALQTRCRSTEFMEYLPASQSVRLGAGELDDLGPFLGFLDEQLAETSGGRGKHHGAQFRKSCFDPGIGEARIDLSIELVDDFRRRFAWGAYTDPNV